VFPVRDRSGNAERRTPDVYAGEESDRAVVPMNPPNKEADSSITRGLAAKKQGPGDEEIGARQRASPLREHPPANRHPPNQGTQASGHTDHDRPEPLRNSARSMTGRRRSTLCMSEKFLSPAPVVNLTGPLLLVRRSALYSPGGSAAGFAVSGLSSMTSRDPQFISWRPVVPSVS